MRSSMVQEELEDNLRTFVPNEGFPRAVAVLRQRHVCIIAGIPGVGKTTLAQALAAAYIRDGFELVDIGGDIEQALEVWVDHKPQIFYYDDFLGQTTLDDKLGANQDVRLINFFRKVERSANKRIVLTTREYILEHARQRYERLANADFDPFTCVIELDDYNDLVRAKVLYNHLYFANLAERQLTEFVEPARHRAILEHPNFSPRLISLALANAVTSTGSAFHSLRGGLDNPNKLWQHVIRFQLDEHQVSVLEALYCLPAATVDRLRNAWTDLCKQKGLSVGASRFRNALEVLEGTLIRIGGLNHESTVSFTNPSLRDYMDRHITEDVDVLEPLLRSAVHFEQVQILSIACRSIASPPVTRPQDLISRRLMELIDRPPLVGALVEALPERYATLLQVANSIGPQSLALVVLERLSVDVDSVVDDCHNLDSLVALLEVVSESEFANEEYPYLPDELGVALLRKIEESAIDWDSAIRARDAIAALEHHDWFDSGAAERVEEIVRESAVTLIEAWREGDRAVRERTDMYEVLEHADDRLVPDDYGNWYSPAEAFSNFISLVEDHPFTGEVPRKPGIHQNNHWPEIAQLFERLLEPRLLDSGQPSEAG
ncbi:hypothetical protein SAMN05421748_11877 [Paractinoplanes atraurantiacus]|uniref:AAA+ ATPase domain-containing protein n=2 Tax=Paractinoplanes atraurantiacus TaxID=1036182 RepID=A0A285JAF8_9ACTN|nr:hypothetical protein SAMN05421748_11877 [Actinoplanes atraurantiacus]